MKLLLIGPYPPPHGGVSVHIYEACRQLRAEGIECRVVNTDRNAPPSPEYLRVSGASGLVRLLVRHARAGWTIHFHTNGHNAKSRLTALLGGLAGRLGPACLLTLHSGMMPGYLRGSGRRRLLARTCCALYGRVIAVSPRLRDALLALGLPPWQLDMQPAFLLPASPPVQVPPALASMVKGRRPLLSTALFFRPEYGFDLLLEAVLRLRARYPSIGCVVMGSGEERAEAERLIGEAGLQRHVLLAGNVSHETCLALLAASDVFVRPTLTDGDAISVREAVALGVPAVASAVGTRPAEAILFPAGNANELVAAIEGALTKPRRESAADSGAGGIGWLIDIYRDAAERANLRQAA